MAKDRDRDRGDRVSDGLEDRLIKVRRSSTTVKGGRRFTFNALVVIGDGKGRVAFGYGKANEVPPPLKRRRRKPATWCSGAGPCSCAATPFPTGLSAAMAAAA